MSNLRKKLDEIIHINDGNNWWNPELFEKYTKNILPGELEILGTPPNSNGNYNCFVYALGLSGDRDLVKDCGGFIYDTLFQKLLDDGVLEYTKNPQKGDYILYRDLKNYPNMITHIGIIGDGDTIVSKWAWGPLFKHKIFDVPESYGDDIFYVKKIAKEKVRELYEKYKKFNTKTK